MLCRRFASGLSQCLGCNASSWLYCQYTCLTLFHCVVWYTPLFAHLLLLNIRINDAWCDHFLCISSLFASWLFYCSETFPAGFPPTFAHVHVLYWFDCPIYDILSTTAWKYLLLFSYFCLSFASLFDVISPQCSSVYIQFMCPNCLAWHPSLLLRLIYACAIDWSNIPINIHLLSLCACFNVLCDFPMWPFIYNCLKFVALSFPSVLLSTLGALSWFDWRGTPVCSSVYLCLTFSLYPFYSTFPFVILSTVA